MDLYQHDDPRPLGGDIAGPGGPHKGGEVVIDTHNAVLLEDAAVAVFDLSSRTGEGPGFALLLGGSMGTTDERKRVLYLMTSGAIVALVSELRAVAAGAGAYEVADEVLSRVVDGVLDAPRDSL